jgi:trimethyllysine dioxygenase
MGVIDNWRVMHGRSAFTGERRMCGAYIGADDWRSKRASCREEGEGIWDSGW